MEPIEDEGLLDAGAKPAPEFEGVPPNSEEIEEVGVVQETLSKVLAEAEPSFQQTNVVKTRP